MAIDVVWEKMQWSNDPTEPGYTVPLATLHDKHSLVQRFLDAARTSDLPYLKFIEPRSETLFHQQDIPQLIEELEVVSGMELDLEVEKHVREVLKFVRKSLGKSKTSISFRSVERS